ncbi:MAG: efflux RND transporter periplasmic adaptor subunit, partial [Ferruginibacter sp.]|nr:efflux RND transporter periplasmic adaptor subunit [Rhodoferax sp.]
MKQNAITLVAAIAIIICAGGLFATYSQAADDSKTAAPKPALTVTTVQPQRSPWAVQLSANGNVAAWQEASIGSEASGLRLLEVRANVGDVVRAGQVLATFAAESVQADVAQAQANVLEAQANAQDASGNAARARTLQTTGALSEQQITQYQTTEQVAIARVAAARATLAVQQQRLRHTQVLAPDNGTISARSATVGAVLGSGTELFRMVRGGRLEWRAEVTAAELERIKVGTTA